MRQYQRKVLQDQNSVQEIWSGKGYRVRGEEVIGRFGEEVAKRPSWYVPKLQHSEEIQHAYFS